MIDVAELQSRLGSDALVVVDCRFNLLEPDAGAAAWRRGHIPGAVYAHLDDDLARPALAHEGRHPLPAPGEFAATLGRLGITPASTVVAYDDQGGAIAARLWWMLGWIGHQDRFLLDGGLRAWEAAELPLEAGATVPVPERYGPIEADESQIVTTAALVEWTAAQRTASSAATLLDARAAARFRGESEPIDPVAGHVPGARNLPFDALLDADGCFLSTADLERVFDAALDTDDPAASVITMCGSGVTACHLLAGLAVTGRTGRLYVGSWSEWIRDATRAIATGD